MAGTIRSGLARCGDREATVLSGRSDGSWEPHTTHALTFLRFSESGVSSLNYTVFPFDVTLDAPLTWCIPSKAGGSVEWNKRFSVFRGDVSRPLNCCLVLWMFRLKRLCLGYWNLYKLWYLWTSEVFCLLLLVKGFFSHDFFFQSKAYVDHRNLVDFFSLSCHLLQISKCIINL